MNRNATSVLLVAASTATSGGGEKHVADLLRGLPAIGVACALACPGEGSLTEIARETGAAVFDVPVAGVDPAGVTRLRSAIAACAPGVVHAHGSRAALFARLADPDAVSRVVYTVHGIHVDKSGSALRRAVLLAVERGLVGRTARFIAVCEADVAKGAALGVLDAARTRVVYNGIEPPPVDVSRGAFRSEIGIADDAPLAACIGRFHEQKDHETLLAAWALVSAARPDAVLALVGSGPLEARLREVVRAAGLSGSVRFVAPRSDIDAVYRDTDVLALSSRWEGLPYVVVEALANGVPVVATAVDGVPEAVRDGVSGFLVPVGDPVAFADRLGALLDSRAIAREMGEAGAAWVRLRFSMAAMLDGVADVYSEVARGVVM